MRYSVVLPRIEPKDTDDARRALDRAHALWEKGEQRAALDQVRQASESADAAGQKGRADVLSKAVVALLRAISPSQFPPQVSEKPPISLAREAAKARAATNAVTGPPEAAPPAMARQTVPAKKPRQAASLSPGSGPVRYGAPTEPTRPAAVSGATPRAAVRAMPSASAAAPLTAPGAVVISAPPAGTAALPERATPIAAVTLAPAQPTQVSSPPDSLFPSPAFVSTPPDVATEEAELVVTIAPSDWALESASALVGYGAQRVAIAPGRGPGGTMTVRPLAAGEVAPKGSVVAVLVALEPGALPLPRTG